MDHGFVIRYVVMILAELSCSLLATLIMESIDN